MGQNSLQCSGNSTAKEFISQQLKIYKWRADPKCNARLPKVTIKNALSYQQQQKYIEFMMLHSQKEMIKITELKSQIQLTPELANQQVVVFQKYVGSLQKVKNLLTLQETLYCLTELLFGFQEIKKMYSQIVVLSSCCFVTKHGQIRSWINQNPKSNKIQSEAESSLLAERQYKEIISRILDVGFQLSSKTPDICNFFVMVRTALEYTVKRNQLFCHIRSIIESFLIDNRLSLKNLKGCLVRMQKQKQLPIINRQQQIRVTQLQQTLMHERAYPQLYNNQIKPSYLQGKTIQSHNSKHSQTSYTTKPSVANLNCLDPSKRLNSANLSIFHQMAHSSVPLQSYPCTNKAEKHNLNTTVRLSQALQKSEKPLRQINKTNTIYKEASFSPPLMPSRSSISQSLKISISNFYNQANIKGHTSDLKNKTSKIKATIKGSNEVSLAETIKCQRPQQKLKRKSEVRCQSVRNVNSSSEVPRPWITTKTISKLITDSPNGSLAHSEGTSQSKESSQLYSGVLTQLARESSQKKASSTSVNEF